MDGWISREIFTITTRDNDQGFTLQFSVRVINLNLSSLVLLLNFCIYITAEASATKIFLLLS